MKGEGAGETEVGSPARSGAGCSDCTSTEECSNAGSGRDGASRIGDGARPSGGRRDPNDPNGVPKGAVARVPGSASGFLLWPGPGPLPCPRRPGAPSGERAPKRRGVGGGVGLRAVVASLAATGG